MSPNDHRRDRAFADVRGGQQLAPRQPGEADHGLGLRQRSDTHEAQEVLSARRQRVVPMRIARQPLGLFAICRAARSGEDLEVASPMAA